MTAEGSSARRARWAARWFGRACLGVGWEGVAGALLRCNQGARTVASCPPSRESSHTAAAAAHSLLCALEAFVAHAAAGAGDVRLRGRHRSAPPALQRRLIHPRPSLFDGCVLRARAVTTWPRAAQQTRTVCARVAASPIFAWPVVPGNVRRRPYAGGCEGGCLPLPVNVGRGST